jgi:hypothetical protein
MPNIRAYSRPNRDAFAMAETQYPTLVNLGTPTLARSLGARDYSAAIGAMPSFRRSTIVAIAAECSSPQAQSGASDRARLVPNGVSE